MGCCQHYELIPGNESAFSIEAPPIVFGRGAIDEAGTHTRTLGLRRVAIFTDVRLRALELFARLERSLRTESVDFEVFDQVEVEPTDQSFLAAARFASEGRFDGYISLGGGSVIDTCKAASLYANFPAEFLTFVNKPIGAGEPIPGPLPPHIAIPTTSGTGSECTGIAVFDLLSLKAKTGIASRRLRPSLALVDPTCTATLSASVVAASGFDVLSHALESFTARPYTSRLRSPSPLLRPMSQGANPWSDHGSLEALRLCGCFLVRAVQDASDVEAREQMMFAATLAGVAFGNAGVHLPHAMSYAVAGLVRDFRMPGYPPAHPMVPHGVSVIVNAPAVFRQTSAAAPDRHLTALQALVPTTRVDAANAGEALAETLIAMMKTTGIPNGLSGVGYSSADLEALTDGAIVQKRLLDNAPHSVERAGLRHFFERGLSYW